MSGIAYGLVGNSLGGPGVAKGYCRINADGTILSSVGDHYNIASITDNSLGVRYILWDTDFADVNYSVVAGQADNLENVSEIKFHTFAVGSVHTRITLRDDSNNKDMATSSAAFGDQ